GWVVEDGGGQDEVGRAIGESERHGVELDLEGGEIGGARWALQRKNIQWTDELVRVDAPEQDGPSVGAAVVEIQRIRLATDRSLVEHGVHEIGVLGRGTLADAETEAKDSCRAHGARHVRHLQGAYRGP